MSFLGGKNKNKQTQSYNNTTNIDTQTQAYQQAIKNAAEQAGNAGPSPLVTGAAGYNTGLQTAGNLGLGAMSGDSAALAKMMDPYQQQVIDANNAQWQHVNQQTQNQINDRATRAGAFGGSRQAIATGSALANNNRAQMGQTAGLLSSGYNNAMNQAQALAGLGYAGAGQNANLGMGGVGNAQQWLMNMLNQGYHGPMGQTSSGASQGNQSGYNLGANIDFTKLGSLAGGGGG